MDKIFKKKRGVEGGGMGIIVVIIILLVSAGVILMVVKSSASKADEKTRIDICRISNEVRVGSEEFQGYQWWNPVHVNTPRICDTIYKTDSNLEVPTEKYPPNEYGTMDEIGDMLKNCWYMWLEGSSEKVFAKNGLFHWGGGYGCHICYVFKIKDEAQVFGYNKLEHSLDIRPYFASDISNKCAPSGGFLNKENEGKFWPCSSPSSEWKIVKSKKQEDCCVRSNDLDVCGNKGGKCIVPDAAGKSTDTVYTNKYDKWSCAGTDEVCYVKEGNYYTYLTYITNFGKRGGSLVSETVDEQKGYGPDNFVTSIAAISIWSGSDAAKDQANLKITSLKFAKDTGCKLD